jgi:hypothetical protein
VQLCDRADVLKLIASSELTLDGIGSEVRFLDEHRIGLHIDHLFQVEGEVDLSTTAPPDGRWIPLESTELTPDGFYLGVTKERVGLGRSVVGSLHTRSRYARLGFEVLCSSNFIVPGFGMTGPAPLVFEITVRRRTVGLNSDTAYCFALIYRISSPLREPNTSDYNARFPIIHMDHRGQGARNGCATLHWYLEP